MEFQAQRGASQAERPSALLKIHLLGRFEVVRAGAPIPPQAWRRRRPADLLKLVALAPGRTLGREQAIDALWPDKDPAAGANNLHRALYDLRQIVGGRWVDIERGQISLRPDAWVDVDAFERATALGTPDGASQAVALYRGDLSPEDLESPWLAARRMALRTRFAEVALPIAREAAAAGDAAVGIPLLRRLLEVEPTSEEAHRMLMRLLAESGRRADALRQYDACEAALVGAGLGPPGAELRALRDAIQRGEVGPAQARPVLDGARRASRRLLGTTDPAPVRGRGPALLLFESLVEQGAGTLVLLGEAGVGKTRLAIEGARIAQARGAAVVAGIAGVEPGGAPYALLADALGEEARAGTCADPFGEPSPRRAATQEERRRDLFRAVRGALEAIGAGRPIFLLLDDVHLADESSLNLLHALAQDARALRLLIVCTCREEAVRAGTPIQMALAHLDCERLARGVRVPRLGLAATREQVGDLAGADAPEEVVAQVYRATDGNPALTEEVVRAWRESGKVAVPSDAGAAIRGRVARLGPRAEALLAAAAVAGRRFELDLVRPISGLTGHDAMTALESCLDARLLDEGGRGYHFHHALARDAIHASLTPERRRSLHAALADAIEEASAGPDAAPAAEPLAWHRREAGQPERAVRHLVAAGHRAVERAGLAEAASFYAEALRLAEATAAGGAERLEILDALGRAQLALGELSGAARSFAAASRVEGEGFQASPEQRARTRRLGALALVAGGHLRHAIAEIDLALPDAQASAPDEAAPLLHLRAQALWHEGRHFEALAAAEACCEAAARGGDHDLVARGRDLAALARAAAGEPLPPADDRTAPADRLQQDKAPEHPIEPHLVLWERDLVADRGRDEVSRAAASLLERARQRGDQEAAAAALLGQGSCALAAGRLEIAEALLREALETFRARGAALGEALALERLGTLYTMHGKLDGGMALLAEGVVAAERGLLRRHALTRLHAAEARNRLASGSAYAAEDAIREASESAARHGDCAVCDATFRPEVVRIALARGRVADAEAETAQLEDLARQRDGRGLLAVARLARGRVLAAQGRTADALTALAAARAAFATGGLAYEAARCARLEIRLGAQLDPAADALLVVDADA